MDKSEAQRAVEHMLGEITISSASVDLVVLEHLALEFELGWVFFFQSRSFVESGDPVDMLAGNAPYIVNRHTGELRVTGTAQPIAYYIDRYVAETGLDDT